MGAPIWRLGLGMPDIPEDVDALVLEISREEVVALRVGRAVSDLMALSDDERLRRQLAHGVFFTFSGWDNDPREVHAIPQCRRYLAALHEQWPYWLHFLAPTPDMWGVLLLCLVECEVEGPGRSRIVRPDELPHLVRGMLPAMNLLHDAMALAPAERDRIFHASLAAIQRCFA